MIPPEPDWSQMGKKETAGPTDDYLYFQFDFPTKNINIHHNIIWTPNARIMAIGHAHEASKTKFNNNMVFRPFPGVPYIDWYGNLSEVTGNFFQDPEFRRRPRYWHVDLGQTPDYDWSRYVTIFDPHSIPGAQRGVGKRF